MKAWGLLDSATPNPGLFTQNTIQYLFGNYDFSEEQLLLLLVQPFLLLFIPQNACSAKAADTLSVEPVPFFVFSSVLRQAPNFSVSPESFGFT